MFAQRLVFTMHKLAFAMVPCMLPESEIESCRAVTMQCFLGVQVGSIATSEMYRTFNMGVGMVVIVPPSDVEQALATDGAGFVLGTVVTGDEVQIV